MGNTESEGNNFFNVLLTQSNSELIRNAINGINLASILSLTDQQGTIVAVNDNFAEICGYSKEELIGRPHSIINSGYHPKKFWMDMWMTVTKKKVWRSEVCNRRKDGRLYWVDSFIYPIENESKDVVHYLSIRNDITEKKNKQLETQDLKGKLEAIYNSTSEANFLVTRSGQILSFNEAALLNVAKTFNKRVNLGDHLLDYIVDEAKEAVVQNLQRCFDENMKLQSERKVNTLLKGDEWFLTSYTPAVNHTGEIFGVSVNFSNITDRKTFELKLQTRNEQLERVAWMQSHGMRAPIATLLGLLHIIDIDANIDDTRELMSRIKHLTQEIDGQIRTMVSHINELDTVSVLS